MKTNVVAVSVVVTAMVAGGVMWYLHRNNDIGSSVLANCQKQINILTQEKDERKLDAEMNQCSKDLKAECTTRVAALDKQIHASSDWQEKKTLFTHRMAIADECLGAWHGGILDGVSDTPLLGHGEFDESDALKKACDDTLGLIDNRLSKEPDFDAKWRIFKDRQEISDWCFEQWLSGRHDESKAPRLGHGELGEKEAMKLTCDETLQALTGRIEKEKDELKRRELLSEKERISGVCLKEWLSGRYDQADVPIIGRGLYATPMVARIDFYDMDNNFTKTDGLPFGYTVHFLVVRAETSTDMRTFLPMKAEIYVDNTLVWSGFSKSDPTLACGTPDACSIDGPQIMKEWKNKKLRIDVLDQHGKRIAQYSK